MAGGYATIENTMDRFKLDGSTKYYEKMPKDRRVYQMWYVYANDKGEKWAGTVCDFVLINQGFESTGEAVYTCPEDK